MRLTIRDIARVSGFSRSTVSLVLNQSPRVSPETRERILAVMRELDYFPSRAAQALAGRGPRTLAVVVPQRSHVFSDYYFSEAVGGIADGIAADGYRILLMFRTPEFRQSQACMHMLKTGEAAGALFVGAVDEDTYLFEVAAAGLPIRLVNSRLGDLPATVANNYSGAYRVIEHLVSQGHERLAIISSPGDVTTSQDRLRGYREALRDYAVALPDEAVQEGDFSEQSGYQCARRLLDRYPETTALVCANDMMAVGALRALGERRILVPDQLSVIGGDDIQLVQYLTPPLTTIRQPIYQIGLQAARQLLAQIQQPGADTASDVVPTQLVIRQSTGPPPARRSRAGDTWTERPPTAVIPVGAPVESS